MDPPIFAELLSNLEFIIFTLDLRNDKAPPLPITYFLLVSIVLLINSESPIFIFALFEYITPPEEPEAPLINLQFEMFALLSAK